MGTFTAILSCLIALGILMLIIIELNDGAQSKNKKYKIQDEMNMLNDTIWIKKVIKSCKTYKQLIHANQLRYILKDKYKNKVDNELLDKVYNDLYLHWDVMKHQIIYA